jgi:hypothetical protein
MVEKAPTPERIDKEREIIELRTEGYVWREIAQQVGMSTAGVYKAYNRAMTRVIAPSIEEHRELELDRLDILQRTYWQPAVNGNLRAADYVLRVIDKRAKLLGLDAPLKVQAEVVTYDGSDLDAEVERVARLIEASTIGGVATITELTDQGEPLGVEEQIGESEPITP